MVNLGDIGRICLNQEIQGVCKGCLWWEWDSRKQQCANSQYHVCQLYRERLFSMSAQLGLGQDRCPAEGLPPAGAESGNPPAATARESGNS